MSSCKQNVECLGKSEIFKWRKEDQNAVLWLSKQGDPSPLKQVNLLELLVVFL